MTEPIEITSSGAKRSPVEPTSEPPRMESTLSLDRRRSLRCALTSSILLPEMAVRTRALRPGTSIIAGNDRRRIFAQIRDEFKLK